MLTRKAERAGQLHDQVQHLELKNEQLRQHQLRNMGHSQECSFSPHASHKHLSKLEATPTERHE